jgi:hypothetical protein
MSFSLPYHTRQLSPDAISPSLAKGVPEKEVHNNIDIWEELASHAKCLLGFV